MCIPYIRLDLPAKCFANAIHPSSVYKVAARILFFYNRSSLLSSPPCLVLACSS